MENKTTHPVISEALIIANSLAGTKEVKNNRGEVIDKIQKEFGFVALPYCVLFGLYCYKQAIENMNLPFIKFPFPNTASSQTLFEWAKKNNYITTDPEQIKPGDFAIWRKWKLWSGHLALITSYLNRDNSFLTIEGNTSNSNFGSQSDGDGIYKRIRYANKIDFSVDGFYLRGFIQNSKIFQI